MMWLFIHLERLLNAKVTKNDTLKKVVLLKKTKEKRRNMNVTTFSTHLAMQSMLNEPTIAFFKPPEPPESSKVKNSAQ